MFTDDSFEKKGFDAETFEAKGGFDRNCKVCKGTGWMPKKGDPQDAKTAKLFGLSIDELTMQPCNAGGKDMGCFNAETFGAESNVAYTVYGIDDMNDLNNMMLWMEGGYYHNKEDAIVEAKEWWDSRNTLPLDEGGGVVKVWVSKTVEEDGVVDEMEKIISYGAETFEAESVLVVGEMDGKKPVVKAFGIGTKDKNNFTPDFIKTMEHPLPAKNTNYDWENHAETFEAEKLHPGLHRHKGKIKLRKGWTECQECDDLVKQDEINFAYLEGYGNATVCDACVEKYQGFQRMGDYIREKWTSWKDWGEKKDYSKKYVPVKKRHEWGESEIARLRYDGIIKSPYGAETFEANSDEDNCPVCNEEVYGDMSMIGEEIVPDICGDCDIYVMPQGSDFKVRCIECGYGDFYGSRTPCESCEPIADKMEAVNNGKSAETFEVNNGRKAAKNKWEKRIIQGWGITNPHRHYIEAKKGNRHIKIHYRFSALRPYLIKETGGSGEYYFRTLNDALGWLDDDGKDFMNAETFEAESERVCDYCEKEAKDMGMVTFPDGLAVCDICFEEQSGYAETFGAEGMPRLGGQEVWVRVETQKIGNNEGRMDSEIAGRVTGYFTSEFAAHTDAKKRLDEYEAIPQRFMNYLHNHPYRSKITVISHLQGGIQNKIEYIATDRHGAESFAVENDPDFDKVKADRNKDGEISDWERTVGNKVAKGSEGRKTSSKGIDTFAEPFEEIGISKPYARLGVISTLR